MGKRTQLLLAGLEAQRKGTREPRDRKPLKLVLDELDAVGGQAQGLPPNCIQLIALFPQPKSSDEP